MVQGAALRRIKLRYLVSPAVSLKCLCEGADIAQRQQITQDRQARALTAEAAVYEHAVKGGKGLRLRVAPTGRKVWMYRYRNRATKALERMVLGTYPKMGLADARAAVDRQRGIVIEHGSARQYRAADHAEKRRVLTNKLATDERSAFTVRKLVDQYLDEASDTLKGCAKSTERYASTSWL